MAPDRPLIPWGDLPEVLEVRGDRGTGKSTMLAEIVRGARERGWTVAAAHPAESLPPVAHELFLDLFDALPAAPPPGGRAPACGASRRRGTLPEERDGDQACPDVLAAVRSRLRAAAPRCGLLVVLDDVQWADRSSLRVLEHLVRRPVDGSTPGGRVCLTVAHRPRQTPHGLRAALDRGVRTGQVRRLAPAPLSAEVALELLPTDLDWRESSRIIDQCRGNPLLLTAYADALRTGAAHSLAEPVLSPEVLTDALRDFSPLSEAARRVAGAATVLTEPFDPVVLRAAADVGGGFDDALDELVRSDVFTLHTPPVDLRFSTWLQRAAAHHAVGAGWLLGAQARADAACGHRPVAGPADPDDPRSAMRVLVEAAARRRWLNAPEAVLWSDAAAAVPGEPGRARVVRGSALALAGRFDGALDTLGRPALLGGTVADRVEAALWCAWSEDMLGRPQAGAAAVAEYLARSPGLADPYRAVLLGAQTASELRAGRRVSVGSVVVLEDLLGAVPPVTRGWLSALLAMAALGAAQPAPIRAAFHASNAALLLDEAGDDAVAHQVDALVWLGEAEWALNRVTAAERHGLRGLRLAQERGFRAHTVVLAALLARHASATGDADAVAKYAGVAEAAVAETDGEHLLALAGRTRAGTRGHTVPGPAAGGRAATLDALSNREAEVALLVSRGCTNQRIARALSISQKTVETHLGRIFRKLTVSSRAEVAALVGRARGDLSGDERPPALALGAGRRRTA